MTQVIVTTPETSITAIAIEEPISKPEAQILWTSADLDLLPNNSKRYEIIDGELYVTRAPHNKHQDTCGNFHCLTLNKFHQDAIGVKSSWLLNLPKRPTP